MIADADALALFAERSPSAPAERVRLLTPHSAEAGRLLGLSRTEVEADRFAALRALEGYGLPILKGRHTLVGGGPVIWVNPTGSPRLASAGSGDVLAGAMAALLAQRVPPREAAAMAVWCHGRAGERMPEGGSARDLLAGLSLELLLQ
jgi:NAD(P)H-hydrate epimerase